MSVLDALDATRLCARWSKPLADPAAWLTPAPTVAPHEQAPELRGEYSWWSLAGNPYALLVTGMVGAVIAKDAVLRILAPAGVRRFP